MKIAGPCIEADAEERTLLAFDGGRRRFVIKKSYLSFLCIQSILGSS